MGHWQFPAQAPQSIAMSAPVIYRAPGWDRKNASSATSSGWIKRRSSVTEQIEQGSEL
jgi:hypothetical protein